MFEQYCNASIFLLIKLAVIANNVMIVCTLTKNHENCELKFNEEPSINDFDIVLCVPSAYFIKSNKKFQRFLMIGSLCQSLFG